MKTLIHYDTDKFTVSLANYLESSVLANTSNVLYKLYFMHNFDICFFTVNDGISREINNFILEFQSKKKIFLYYTNPSAQDYSTVFKYVTHISRNGIKLSGKHIELPEYFFNEKLFTKNSTEQRIEKYCVFLGMSKSIPEKLQSILYPNTKIPINMFESPYIKHCQNMGMISEIEKAKILQTYKYFINVDSLYAHEAQICGCQLVDITKDNTLQNNNIETKATPIKTIIKDMGL